MPTPYAQRLGDAQHDLEHFIIRSLCASEDQHANMDAASKIPEIVARHAGSALDQTKMVQDLSAVIDEATRNARETAYFIMAMGMECVAETAYMQ